MDQKEIKEIELELVEITKSLNDSTPNQRQNFLNFIRQARDRVEKPIRLADTPEQKKSLQDLKGRLEQLDSVLVPRLTEDAKNEQNAFGRLKRLWPYVKITATAKGMGTFALETNPDLKIKLPNEPEKNIDEVLRTTDAEAILNGSTLTVFKTGEREQPNPEVGIVPGAPAKVKRGYELTFLLLRDTLPPELERKLNEKSITEKISERVAEILKKP